MKLKPKSRTHLSTPAMIALAVKAKAGDAAALDELVARHEHWFDSTAFAATPTVRTAVVASSEPSAPAERWAVRQSDRWQDARQAAVLAFLEQLERFDPDRGIAPMAFARREMRTAAIEAVRCTNRAVDVPARTLRDVNGPKRMASTTAAVAAATGEHASIFVTDESGSWGCFIPADTDVEAAVVPSEAALAAATVEWLPDTHAAVVTLMFGLGAGSTCPLSARVIADKLQLSSRRVYQLRDEALEMLRDALAPTPPTCVEGHVAA